MNIEPCYICGSIRFVDNHHYDKQEGRISPDTVPLCRRCHRTYHDWGLGSFSPDTLTRALEVENKRRMIYHLPLMAEGQIEHSSYWCNKWAIRKKSKVKVKVVSSQLPLFEVLTRAEAKE